MLLYADKNVLETSTMLPVTNDGGENLVAKSKITRFTVKVSCSISSVLVSSVG